MNNPFNKVGEPLECVCKRSDGLFIPNRQVSLLMAAALMILFTTFLTGYFFGKKYIVEQFVAKIEQDSFADQIYSSLCALGECDPDELKRVSLQNNPEVPEVSEIPEAGALVQEADVAVQEPVEDVRREPVAADAKKYYAQLVGYGTELAAQRFAQRLESKGIPVDIQHRVSTTAKGKKRTWYQVVTNTYYDREALDKLVDRISKQEKIKGVHIVSC